MSYQVQYIYDLQNKISGKLNQIQNDFAKHTKGINQALNKASQSLQQHGKQIRNTGLKYTAFISTPLALVSKSFIKAASDAEETTSKFNVVFKDVRKEADATAKTIAKGYGMSIIKTKQLLSDTGDLLSGFGFTGAKALDLSKEVQKLAVDLASFTNYAGGAEGASIALTKALLGEREMVKSLGISILEEDVKNKIAILRAKGMTFETERQAKAYATLLIAQQQSKNAIGDYGRTQAGFANQSRLLSQRLLDLKISFGNLVLPQATVFLGKIIKLTERINELSPRTKKAIMVIGGLGIVLPPIIASIGLLAIGIGGLASPIGLAITGFTTLAGVGGVLYAKFEPVRNLLNDIVNIIKTVSNAFVNVGGFLFENVAKGLGFDFDKKYEVQSTVNDPRTQMAQGFFNQKQSIDMGGELNINVGGLPSGSNVDYTPAKNSKLQVKLNSAF
jgi:biotin operon repressor